MGGNVAMLYAGVRPERIRRLVNLEGFGLAATKPEEVAGALCALDRTNSRRCTAASRTWPTMRIAAGVARRLMPTTRGCRPDKADWLAQHWAEQQADGRWKILGDPAHKIIGANLYQVPETLALYARITAPTLVVEASEDSLTKWWGGKYTLAEFHERLKAVPNLRVERIEDASHMLHHDQPLALAQLVEAFLACEADVAA